MSTTPYLGIPELAQSQANPDVTHNEAIVLMQALLGGVIDKDLTAPPGSPSEGDAYLINTAAPTGAWSGYPYRVAIYWGGSWRFVPGVDDAGTPITMGANQEGLRVWVRDENKMYTWRNTVGSPLAWHWSAVVEFTASDIANTPAGNIAATNVQTALNELDTEKAGIALANTFTAVPQVIQETGATQQYILRLVRVDNGASGPYIESYMDSASPAANDFIGGWHWFSRDSAANKQFYGAIEVKILDPTSTTEDSELQFYNVIGGTTSLQLGVANGLLVGGATGSYQGSGNVNAVNYFDDGVNINTIYAALAGASFTGQVKSTLTGGTTIASSALLAQSDDAGANGPSLGMYHNSASPAAGDLFRHMFFANNTSAAAWRVAQFAVIVRGVTAGAEDGEFNITTTRGGTLAARLNVANGVWLLNATGADQGDGTINATGVYANGNLVADTNALVRMRVYTVATLPAVVAGARAFVSDASVAYNGTNLGGIVTGGGINPSPVIGISGSWVIG